ncbi:MULTISPECIES: hypothetical protein [unclassified Mesorhizobium]|uniref:hypothetical protein n=3 Tax=Mesorhizobium TaxID=68287 RepID=UPI0003F6C0C3|nr:MULTISPECIES: hypothetical protein [unclassified Mesorhizobium]RUY56145.1 hypothetical protein EN981_05785 [Mesorhizobium sp. M7A.F.Ca.CA.001.13.2.1]RVA73193.1 hypothetical protein EN916_22665 [Mesorhizobium sp. M7A.F.Ca.CA.001.11.2.1]
MIADDTSIHVARARLRNASSATSVETCGIAAELVVTEHGAPACRGASIVLPSGSARSPSGRSRDTRRLTTVDEGHIYRQA